MGMNDCERCKQLEDERERAEHVLIMIGGIARTTRNWATVREVVDLALDRGVKQCEGEDHIPRIETGRPTMEWLTKETAFRLGEKVCELREALREKVLVSTPEKGVWQCGLCKQIWYDGDPERHEDECLAALEPNEETEGDND